MALQPTFIVVVLTALLFSVGLVESDVTATCSVASGSGVGTVSGTIRLSQAASGGTTTIRVQLSGFGATGSTSDHGFHIHESGDLGNKCNNSGGHYNPSGIPDSHGAPTDAQRHNGDLGNIQVDSNGNVDTTITDNFVTLIGNLSSIGRAFVVHEMVDDLGRGSFSDSKTTGHAGRRLGCCTIISGAPTLAIATSAAVVAVFFRFLAMNFVLFN